MSVEQLSVSKAFLGRLVGGPGGGLSWRTLSSYTALLMGFSLKAQNNILTSHVASPERSHSYDLVVVGGGIVGMATARELSLRHPKMRIALVEKAGELATGQSGHNSGVIHQGLYYAPGSLKARLCVQGSAMMYSYLREKGIPHRECGKVVVAVNDKEAVKLKALHMNALTNGCPGIRLINQDELRSIEPHCQGVLAIHSPHTGVVNWADVTNSFARDFKSNGGNVYTRFEVCELNQTDDGIKVRATSGAIVEGRWMIACCGLYSDRVAAMAGLTPEPRIVPFRGEYLLLKKPELVNGNIYPVPDSRFPFLGVHFTPRVDGSILIGPNAVLATSREGYGYLDFNWTDFKEMMSYSGLRKLLMKHWMFGAGEFWRSINKRAQLKHIRKYIPQITAGDLRRGPTGVRAMALAEDGSLVGDFVFQSSGNSLHVRNAPSPAATSSMAIAAMIADKASQEFHWK